MREALKQDEDLRCLIQQQYIEAYHQKYLSAASNWHDFSPHVSHESPMSLPLSASNPNYRFQPFVYIIIDVIRHLSQGGLFIGVGGDAYRLKFDFDACLTQ
ncbi:hypothetical protein ANRL2_00293 [Anaerolineae bacterium]|nr:hypothetical protein ANRL2_00293 [Anaerolineae bacterium]